MVRSGKMSDYYLISNPDEIEYTVSRIRGNLRLPPESLSTAKMIVNRVSERGDQALIEFTKQFDGVTLSKDDLEVSHREREEAWNALEEEIKNALVEASNNIKEFALRTLLDDWYAEVRPGVKVGQLYRPVKTAGIYIPGGRYPYPSTVLMTGILASTAQVENIVFCIPPDKSGQINHVSLAASALVERSRVFRIGGAQAIAAMALGTESVPKCEFIAGPGNVYVTAAKRILSSEVSIDLEAGPSEVAILIDGSCDLSFPAADALAQLEHDPMAMAIVVSESGAVLKAFRGIISGMSEGAGEVDEPQVSYVECASRELSIEFLNLLAPEHLELMVEEPGSIVGLINSAGCLFIGPYSPAVMGDYVAGPSHVLPTGGTASRLSGLSAQSFRRAMNVVSYEKRGFERESAVAKVLSGVEGLKWHGLSVDIRLRRGSNS